VFGFICGDGTEQCRSKKSFKGERNEGKETETTWRKLEHDPRITPVGRFLRKTSIDELPQFFNTLFGSMSIVGPRPEIPEIVKGYSAFQKQALFIRPGITGLPQVNGRADLTIPKKLRLDVYYTKHNNICFDLYIIFKTIIVLFTGKGAF